MQFGISYPYYESLVEVAGCVYMDKNNNQIDILKFEFLSLFKEYYLDVILVKSKKTKRWIHEK